MTGAVLAREELFAGWRLFFERLAAQQPVVLLVEDAQYADTGLLDFLEHLIDWVRDLPIYVLVFARPELGQTRPGFGAGRNRSTLTLDPLDAASMDALVEALVPGMSPAARAKITGQAQGIPLFAVETVRSLIDQDIVQPIEGAYRLAGEVGELAVPDSLHALLAARLDALDPDARRLVADAAVLGTTFPAEALIAVSGQDEAMVRAALAELVRREVLSVSADPLSPERGSYRFAQDMLRQVAYGTLSRRDRKARHLTVAAHLRAAFPGDGEEVAEVIARHYLDALQAVPDDPDTAQIRGQAISALVRAAERAERTGAPARAAASYAAAADLTLAAPAGGPAAAGHPSAGSVGTRRQGRRNQRRLGPGRRAAGRAREYHLQAGQARAAARAQAIAGRALASGAVWRGARAAHRIRRGAAGRSRYRHGTRPGEPGDGGDIRRLARRGPAVGRGAVPRPGPRRRRRRAQPPTHNPRALPHHTNRRPQAAAYYRESARLADQAGDTMRLGEPCSTCRTQWRAPIPGRRRKPPGPPPGTCAGPVTGTAWLSDRQPGPGAADARRLGRRRRRAHPGRRFRRAGRR